MIERLERDEAARIASVTSPARGTKLSSMDDYYPSGAVKFGAFDPKANAPPPLTKGSEGPENRPPEIGVHIREEAEGQVRLVLNSGYAEPVLYPVQVNAFCDATARDRMGILRRWLDGIPVSENDIAELLDGLTALCDRRRGTPGYPEQVEAAAEERYGGEVYLRVGGPYAGPMLSSTQVEAFCNLTQQEDRARTLSLWLTGIPVSARAYQQMLNGLNAICDRRFPRLAPLGRDYQQTPPTRWAVPTTAEELRGRLYPLRYVIDRGSVIQIDWPEYGETRTVHRSDLKDYCGFDDAGRTAWVASRFGVPVLLPFDSPEVGRRNGELAVIRQQLDQLCYGQATPVESNIAREVALTVGRTYPAGQVPTTTPPAPATGLPDWAKYLIGGAIGLGAGYGILVLTSAEPRPNYRRR